MEIGLARGGHQVLTRSVGRGRSTRRRMSSTTQPLAMHRTGFRSASTISGVSRSSSAKRSTSSRSAVRSRRGRPRDPSSCVVTCSDAVDQLVRVDVCVRRKAEGGGAGEPAVPAAEPDRHHPPELRIVNRPHEQIGSWWHEPLHDRSDPWPSGLLYASLELSPAGSDRCFAFQAEQDGVDVACVSRRPTPGLERDRPADLLGDRDRVVNVLAPVRGHIRQAVRCEQSLRFVAREPCSAAWLAVQTGADQLAGGRWIEIPVAGRLSDGSRKPGASLRRARENVRAGLGEAEVRHA